MPVAVRQTRRRYVTIDLMRAIAIILVVIGHFEDGDYPAAYECGIKVIYSFHMPLFMFVSGFVYIATWRPVGYREFVAAKFRRLMIPYFVISIFVITVKLMVQGDAPIEQTVTPSDYLTMFLYPSAGYFLWFIWALWWMMLLVGLFHGTGAHLVMLAVSFVAVLFQDCFPEIFALREFARDWVYFMSGIVLFEVILHPLRLVRTDLTVCSVFLFAILNYVIQCYGTLLPRQVLYVLMVVTAFLGIYLSVVLCRFICRFRGTRLYRLLLSLSAASYVVYLLNNTFVSFARTAVFRLFPAIDLGVWSDFIPAFIFVTMTGLLIPWWLGVRILPRTALTRAMFGLTGSGY